jgi:CelD/BcsL family acetyltransferase involved in cellulose biosynthesis
VEKGKLSAREAALIEGARREAEARKTGNPLPPAPHAAGPATPPPAAAEKSKASPAERLAQLMAEERAETERMKKKMRRYGIIIPAAILAVFALWLLRTFTRRR